MVILWNLGTNSGFQEVQPEFFHNTLNASARFARRGATEAGLEPDFDKPTGMGKMRQKADIQ
jgi:hypothetical protein